jgi:predicted amidophosphoribosyltransferase
MLCSKCNQAADTLTDSGLCEDCHAQAEGRRFEIIELARQ